KFLGTVKFGNDQIAPIIGYRDLVQGAITIKRVYYVEGLNHNLFFVGQFCDADLEVSFRKSTCFIRDLKGNDLLTASSSQAWLWHRRLSYLNFDTINLLSMNDIVVGLPKLKFIKDHLCSSCELGKAKRKSKDETPEVLIDFLRLVQRGIQAQVRIVRTDKGTKILNQTLHVYFATERIHHQTSKDETPEVLIDFLRLVQRGIQAQVRIVRTDKGTKFLNQTLHVYFAIERIHHQTSVARTPEQNGVVERRNRTLVEAARTMLSAAKVPLFFRAEAIATTCFTQNRSLVIPRHEKTPYHIINNRKPSVKFFHIFGSLCYIVRDGKNLDKMKEKGDECIFLGHSTQSRAYRVFNKRTRVIMESIHVNFDELPHMASDHISSDPALKCQRMALEHDNLSLVIQRQANVPQADRIVTTSNELDLLFSLMFDELLNGSSKVVSKSFDVCSADAPNQHQHHTTPLNNHTTPAPTYQVPTLAPTVTSSENINQAEMNAENDQVADDEFINIFYTLVQDQGETSSRHVDSSNMHTFYQRYPSEYRWTKDHQLEQVIGNPSQFVRTRRQLELDVEICMFTLTVSQTEPKNIKGAMANSAWIESMQEELHQDGENLDKMKEKGDECIFVGYSTQLRAYIVFNKRTIVIMESIHVNFDELPKMASDQNSSDPVPKWHKMALEHDSSSPGCKCQENVSHGDKTVTTLNEMDLLFSPMFDELLNGPSQVVSKSSAIPTADESIQRQQQQTTPLVNHTTPDQSYDEFINIFSTPVQEQGETSSHHVDSSNMHTFYQRYPSEHRWIKDHPLEQVIGNPSQSIRTRRQLELDAEMCMFALTEELHQFDRLDVWELVDRPLCTNVINLKWLWKNKRDEENTVIRNTSCKLTTFSNSFKRRDFSKSKSVTQNNVSNDFSKPVTAQTLPPNKKSILKNTNVLAPGMYKLHTDHTQARTSQLPQDSRKTNKRVSFSTGVISTTSVSRPQIKSNPMGDRVMRNNSQGKKQEVEDQRRNVKLPQNKTSVTACNDSLNAKTLNVNSVSAMCDKYVLNGKHDMCVLNSVTKPIKRTVASESNQKSKNITRKLYERVSKTCSWWYPKFTPSGYKWKPKSGKENVNPNVSMPLENATRTANVMDPMTSRHSTVSNTPLSYNSLVARRDCPIHLGQFCDADLEVAFRKSTCFIRNLKGNDLLIGSRGTDLYLITLQDTNYPNPIFLMAKATSSQAWLWHRRLSHLNFDTINLLSKNDIVIHLDLFLRSKDETPEVLIDFLRLVQRGLQAQVRVVRTDKGTEFFNQTLHAYFATEGILHQTSVARTPEQNGVVERRNRTLVEAARTMLSAAKVPLFFWAEEIATACFTQNHSLVIHRHEKTPNHIINDRKPSVKFFHIFGSLCYIVRDGENLDKMKEKGDACIFVGYSTQSRAYRVFNKRTRVIMESIHVNFDELPHMTSDHVSSDPAPECQRMALEHDSLSLAVQCQDNVTHADKTVTTSNELDLLFSPMFDELLNGSSKVVSKSFVVTTADAPNQRQQHTTPLNTHTTPAPTCQVPTQVPTVASNENINQAEMVEQYAQVENDEFINIFYTPIQNKGETSSQQVIGNPSQSVRTRRQLESDGEMCMFVLTLSRTEPKNIKEAMADFAWIESMQEELHQFDRLEGIVVGFVVDFEIPCLAFVVDIVVFNFVVTENFEIVEVSQELCQGPGDVVLHLHRIASRGLPWGQAGLRSCSGVKEKPNWGRLPDEGVGEFDEEDELGIITPR
nr:retrovirus-related Pol polyprotein from transposon TNT 1-94 [Tanacetum cinerariifolium]